MGPVDRLQIFPGVRSLRLLSQRQRERFQELGILEFENIRTSDVRQDVEEEQRIRAGEISPITA